MSLGGALLPIKSCPLDRKQERIRVKPWNHELNHSKNYTRYLKLFVKQPREETLSSSPHV